MGICHPDILRTERFGSRTFLRGEKSRCCFCDKDLKEDEFILDITGNLFCDEKCREGRMERLKTRRAL